MFNVWKGIVKMNMCIKATSVIPSTCDNKLCAIDIAVLAAVNY